MCLDVETMAGKGLPAAIKTKAIAAVAIISVLVLLYVLTTGGAREIETEERRGVDTSTCETAQISEAQVKAHAKCSLRDIETNDFWIIVDGYVFDVTDWITQHPGGEALCLVDTKSSSSYFHKAHVDWENIFTQMMKPRYCIGKYSGS